MNFKTLIPAAALLPALAAAEVQLYGNIRSGVEVSQTQSGAGRRSSAAVSDLGSYIGLRGSHPIGGGTRAVWQFEQNTPVGRSGPMREYFREKKAASLIRPAD